MVPVYFGVSLIGGVVYCVYLYVLVPIFQMECFSSAELNPGESCAAPNAGNCDSMSTCESDVCSE